MRTVRASFLGLPAAKGSEKVSRGRGGGHSYGHILVGLIEREECQGR